ncbi:DNA replication ATP-dependent helicase/nuclease DNA2 isoform X2 [Aplysia californica]|uniref:DNA replication ATP-dependent helicase/nuclease DNA2 n=1 Tax=Aplysia californica TaxID=6500 RepID=A0ABM1A1T6_APLCA|nr:DNA replication ATP-dependent helicase/nuclease DNA2 isoform X2 [Aplysia californica]
MVKQVKKKEQDENQTKISSFFRNPSGPKKEKESGLFTKISSNTERSLSLKEKGNGLKNASSNMTGPQKTLKKPNSKLRLREAKKKTNYDDEDDVLCIDDDKDTGSKAVVVVEEKNALSPISYSPLSSPNTKEESVSRNEPDTDAHVDDVMDVRLEGATSYDTANVCKLSSSGSAAPKADDKQVGDGDDSTDENKSPVFKSPFSTPEKNKREVESQASSPKMSVESMEGSPDIICDTPEVDKVLKNAAAKRKQICSSRSFLRATDLLAVQPDLKPAHLRGNGHRNRGGRKGIVSVSFSKKIEEAEGINALGVSASCKEKDSLVAIEEEAENKPEIILSVPETQMISEIKACDVGKEECSKKIIEESVAMLNNVKGNINLEECESDQPEQNCVGAMELLSHKQTQEKRHFCEMDDFLLEKREDFEKVQDVDKKPGLTRRTKSDVNISPLSVGRGAPRTRSRLIEALEDVDKKVQENDEQIWVNEIVIKMAQNREAGFDSGVSLSDIQPCAQKFSAKRESLPGLSPLSKRPKLKSDVVDLSDVPCKTAKGAVRKKLELSKGEETVEMKRRKTSKDRMAMFGFKGKQKSKKDEKVTLHDDDLLSEVLGKLNSPSKRESNTGASVSPLKEKQKSAGQVHTLVQEKENVHTFLSLCQNIEVNSEDIEMMEETFKQFGEASTGGADGLSRTEEAHRKTNEAETVDCIDAETKIDCSKTLEDSVIVLDSENTDEDNKDMFPDSDCIIAEGSEEMEKFDTSRNRNSGDSDCVIAEGGVETEKFDTSKNRKTAAVGRSCDAQDNICQSHEIGLMELPLENVTESSAPFEVSGSQLTTTANDVFSHHSRGNVEVALPPLQSCGKTSANAVFGGYNTSTPKTTDNKQAVPPTSKELAVEATVKSAESGVTEDPYLLDSLDAMFDESFHEKSPVKKKNKSALKANSRRSPEFCFTDLWERYTVKTVCRKSDESEVFLTLVRDGDCEETLCTLQGFWADTVVKEGDIVNIIGERSGAEYVISDKSGLIVINPDLLLSGTLVVSSVFCLRKSVLNEKYKGMDTGNAHMLYGSIIHSLFQSVLRDGLLQETEISRVAQTLLGTAKFLHDMYSRGMQEKSVMDEINNYIPALKSWLENHSECSKQTSKKSVSRSDVTLTDIQDIEENIWSPRLGLKGKIDLTVKTKLKGQYGVCEKVLPLELKTGKASFSVEHQGQVTLYSMMSAERRTDPGQGLLLYLKHNQMKTIDVKPEAKSGLIQLRNRLAEYLRRLVRRDTLDDGQVSYLLGQIPPPINNERACSKCAHLLSCSMYQRLDTDQNIRENHAMGRLVPESLQHLGQEDLSYFSHWTLCLDLEDEESSRARLKQIWTMSSRERESMGDCIGNLVISCSALGIPESQCFTEGKGCSLTFLRHPDHSGLPLNSVGLVSNDMVVVSSEDGRYIALATGFIRTLSESRVEVVVDRDQLHDTQVYTDMKFRLDRNDSFSMSSHLHTNLCRLMEATSQAEKLRNLIIKLHKPAFQLQLPKNHILKVKSVFRSLNKPQRAAVLKVLMAKDFALIKGYPGTGKTSTIVALVKILRLLGQSVLLTSYTHSAVDNILLKLKQDEVPFLRVGRQSRVHPSILPHCAEILTSSPSINSVQKLKDFYDSYDIVATTCLGTSSHPLFDQRTFDVCIVDEASQVLQPACLGPLFRCRRFVLVGDPQQLPPLVQSKTASSLGMGESLFAKLDSQGATFELHLQYRMNRKIMELSNDLVYNGKLQCGNDDVAEQRLDIPLVDSLKTKPEWMQSALSCEMEKSVVFLSTDRISAPEVSQGNSLTNHKEAEIVMSLLLSWAEAGVDASTIGVISPYRSQVKYLQQQLQRCPLVAAAEANTVDQYQGRDKEIIVMSFVRSGNAGHLLKDIRRLNVAMTRARFKLVFVGSVKTLRTCEPVSNLIRHIENMHNIIEIPE